MKTIAAISFIMWLFLSTTNNYSVENMEKIQTIQLSTEAQLKDPQYAKRIESFYGKGEEGYFEGKAGKKIYYRIFRQHGPEKGAIMLSTGRTEGAVKYKELLFDLYNNGYSVYIHDHRGQGLSGRMADDPEMGYIDDFNFYIEDMNTFYKEYVHSNGHDKVFLIAHSMGGAIGLRYLEQYPGDFNAAAICSPMLGVSAYACPLAKILSGKEPKYAPGQKGYADNYDAFEGNTVTGSKIRYNRKIEAYEAVPEAKVGGASVQWVNELCKGMKEIHKHVDQIRTPFFMFTGDTEDVVNPAGFAKFIDRAEKSGITFKHMLISDAKHELLMEKDEQRTLVISTALDWFEKY